MALIVKIIRWIWKGVLKRVPGGLRVGVLGMEELMELGVGLDGVLRAGEGDWSIWIGWEDALEGYCGV